MPTKHAHGQSSGGRRLCCANCADHALNLCLMAAEAEFAAGRPLEIDQSVHTVSAGQAICRPRELHDLVPIICEGWAASAVILADGRKQILSFLLPGDVASIDLLFERQSRYLVEAITEVRCRAFQRDTFRELLVTRPDAFDMLSRAWTAEKNQHDRFFVDLERRPAAARIVRLIANLAAKLARRGMIDSRATAMPFPLRRHHLADATALTVGGVNRALSDLRQSGVVDLDDGVLTILDRARFAAIARSG